MNPLKGKQLTNIRAAGKDDNILLTPALRLSLEQALDFIDEDELVEVTPLSIRLRKKLLKEVERRRAGRRKDTEQREERRASHILLTAARNEGIPWGLALMIRRVVWRCVSTHARYSSPAVQRS